MIGLIIGVLWFVFASLVGKQAPEAALVDISNVLFYWYAAWWGLIMLVWFCVWVIACLADRTAGVAMTIATPILCILTSLSSALYCTSMYLVYYAGDATTPIQEWDQGYLIGAGVCVGLAIIFGFAIRMSKSGSKY
jgi:hypothetical protein